MNLLQLNIPHMYLIFTKISRNFLPLRFRGLNYKLLDMSSDWINSIGYIGHHVSLQPLISFDFYSHPSQISEWEGKKTAAIGKWHVTFTFIRAPFILTSNILIRNYLDTKRVRESEGGKERVTKPL